MISCSILKADSNALVNQICLKTDNPSFCITVLNSNPGTASADLQGLATIAINLALNNATDTSNYISSLLVNSTDNEQKDQFTHCKDSYEFITDDLNTAGRSLGSHDYQEISVMAGAMADQVKYCESVVKSTLSERNKNMGYLVGIILSVSNLLKSSS
ncbi:Pectinesterase inhibitor domain [Macleaya cordata]|uniref:Pectinesterase inhibitor domain n=1 Tax=Macleaya cordata TaxID=56857 RepID=A0A200R1T1_MACCD|nr:Pectinesterase inhibitor domain [Macleaya cordata]